MNMSTSTESGFLRRALWMVVLTVTGITDWLVLLSIGSIPLFIGLYYVVGPLAALFAGLAVMGISAKLGASKARAEYKEGMLSAHTSEDGPEAPTRRALALVALYFALMFVIAALAGVALSGISLTLASVVAVLYPVVDSDLLEFRWFLSPAGFIVTTVEVALIRGHMFREALQELSGVSTDPREWLRPRY